MSRGSHHTHEPNISSYSELFTGSSNPSYYISCNSIQLSYHTWLLSSCSAVWLHHWCSSTVSCYITSALVQEAGMLEVCMNHHAMHALTLSSACVSPSFTALFKYSCIHFRGWFAWIIPHSEYYTHYVVVYWVKGHWPCGIQGWCLHGVPTHHPNSPS